MEGRMKLCRVPSPRGEQIVAVGIPYNAGIKCCFYEFQIKQFNCTQSVFLRRKRTVH